MFPEIDSDWTQRVHCLKGFGHASKLSKLIIYLILVDVRHVRKDSYVVTAHIQRDTKHPTAHSTKEYVEHSESFVKIKISGL